MMNRHNPAQRGALAAVLLIGAFGAGSCRDSNEVSLEEYRQYLNLSQVRSSYYTEPSTQRRYALVEGSISNLGSRKLIVVELTLHFRDRLHNVVHEEQVYPIYVSELARTDASHPLNPGEKTRFAVKSVRCPPSWQPGQVDVEITKIVADPDSA